MKQKLIQPPLSNSRYVARHVMCDGIEYSLSFVEFEDDVVHISPYIAETHSTIYVDTLVICTENGKLKYLKIN